MTPQESFARLVGEITASIAGRPLDSTLDRELNERFPPSSAIFQKIEVACREAVKAGWMCNREAGGIRFGRVVKPGSETHGFSVDVVEMPALAGPHHRHPNGEIDLIFPIEEGAKFDDRPAGWLVYGPDSSHQPTVTGGRARILYLLPAGAIEFTKP
jgi:hypothetical protein